MSKTFASSEPGTLWYMPIVPDYIDEKWWAARRLHLWVSGFYNDSPRYGKDYFYIDQKVPILKLNQCYPTHQGGMGGMLYSVMSKNLDGEIKKGWIAESEAKHLLPLEDYEY